MELSFKIGTRTENVRVPDEAVLDVLEPNEVPVGLTGQAEVRRALAEPIGTPRLREIVRAGEKVAWGWLRSPSRAERSCWNSGMRFRASISSCIITKPPKQRGKAPNPTGQGVISLVWIKVYSRIGPCQEEQGGKWDRPVQRVIQKEENPGEPEGRCPPLASTLS